MLINRGLRCRLVMAMVNIAVCGCLYAQSTLSLNSSNIVWKVKPQADVKDDADKLQTANYVTDTWVKAIVPGTVFASYVAAGLEKDPNFSDNIYQVDKAKYDRNYWYCTAFEVPASFTKEKIWLNFKGVNRKGEVFLNGIHLGTLSGIVQRGQFDVTELLRKQGRNVLAVLISLPEKPLNNYGSPTYISSAGWDWMPYVPGLNTGITDEVSLSNTGTLVMEDPWVRSSLATNARADLSVSVSIKNASANYQSGEITGTIQPGNIQFTKNIGVDAGRNSEILLDKSQFPQLTIDNPKLWWPNGYGKPNLYTCSFVLKMGDNISDTQRICFGIKKYTYDTIGNVLHISINGTKVFVKGGDWGMSEYMLRCRGNEYDTKVRLHKEMNLNMIRNWLGSVTDDAFYEACDKYGIMVWDDFWLNANPNLPSDMNAFNSNIVEKLKRERNHPSVAIWCGANEGWPVAPLNGWIRENIKTFDGGDRYYQPNSHAENLTGSGVWGNKSPKWYFTPYPEGYGGLPGWGFRTEIGTSVFPNVESLKKFMPQDKLWPKNELWNKHFFGQSAFNATPEKYEADITERYGKPDGIEDFCRKAQLLNMETNKAMYEGWEDNIWEDASGIMTWMSQSAYPSMVWQTYDYYYDLTGAFWGVKAACEPLHIQYNPLTNAVKVINTTAVTQENVTAEATIYNMDGKEVKSFSGTETVTAHANTGTQCFIIPFYKTQTNLALNKAAVASSIDNGKPADITDGSKTSRWASRQSDNEWVYVDLQQTQTVNRVVLNWETAYAKHLKIQVSDDAKAWKDVAKADGKIGLQTVYFEDVPARYIRMLGIERGSDYGYSLWDFEVYGSSAQNSGLTDVHFIKLQLKDAAGKLMSENFYWRGNNSNDFTALNKLSKVVLKSTSNIIKRDGKYFINTKITNPINSPAIAFAIRVQATKQTTGEQILPAIMSANYFSLLPGETKEIQIEFEENLLKEGDKPIIKVEPYNNAGK